MLSAIKGLIDSFGDAVDKNVTSDEERMILRNQLAELESSLHMKMTEFQEKMNQGQVEINKVEASSSSFFKSGWRPAVGWIGVFGLFYQFIGFPILLWYVEISNIEVNPPVIDDAGLMSLVTAMLGIGGYRTYEKFKGITK